MNLLIEAARIYTPASLKRRKLEELFACTAEAFGCEVPRVQGLSYDELLQAYARFTSTQANQALRRHQGSYAPAPGPDVIAIDPKPRVIGRNGLSDEAIPSAARQGEIALQEPPAMMASSDRDAASDDLAEIKRRLYDGAHRIGQELRHTFRVANTADALATARVLYRALGIDLQATSGGEITVRRCFFSEYYSGPVCEVIASLDAGLFAGLSNGGRLTFCQRITEGHECCRAHFRG